MINATVAGNIGKDAETREAGGNTVTSFSVASSTKKGREETTTWVNCSLWGNRGPALAQYLTKGKQVCVSGSLTTRVYNDKTYVELNVNDVKLMGGKRDEVSGGDKPASNYGSDPDDELYPEKAPF